MIEKNIGYVPQSGYILDSDIKENTFLAMKDLIKKLIDSINFLI